MMDDFVSFLLNASVLIFAVSSMLATGLSYSVQDILLPLRNRWTVFATLIANFLLVPLLAWFIIQVMPLDRPLSIGLFLIGSAAGAPFLIKLTMAAGQNVAVSAGLLVLLVPATIIYMPLVVPWALPLAEIRSETIALPLIMTMMLPLAAGFILKARSVTAAQILAPWLNRISTITLIILVASTFAANYREIIPLFTQGAILAALLLTVGAFVIGYLLGGHDPGSREELALATAQRNIAAATVVATQTVRHPDTLNMVILTSLVALAILFLIALSMRKKAILEKREEVSAVKNSESGGFNRIDPAGSGIPGGTGPGRSERRDPGLSDRADYNHPDGE